ncbi:hypothetical protein OPV22_032271 [Ensete ventricosum]|uniref:SMP domain-containing protein n=1 Tax=Ensete ventricosum TaxID=4639 RepID=A0AAV8PWX7_ENSVE|nr:hypothetical protein OPV22_032271 [Ensete ventricosum]RWV82295.1 hypothetical protein GW17_00056213 [Ensete ventricosum]RWW80324.1 hypothetical protein BHE74_00011329 [Ensete ventricosum]
MAAAQEVTGRFGGAVREDPVAAAAAREAPYKGLLQPVEEGGVPLLRPIPAAGASRHLITSSASIDATRPTASSSTWREESYTGGSSYEFRLRL